MTKGRGLKQNTNLELHSAFRPWRAIVLRLSRLLRLTVAIIFCKREHDAFDGGDVLLLERKGNWRSRNDWCLQPASTFTGDDGDSDNVEDYGNGCWYMCAAAQSTNWRLVKAQGGIALGIGPVQRQSVTISLFRAGPADAILEANSARSDSTVGNARRLLHERVAGSWRSHISPWLSKPLGSSESYEINSFFQRRLPS
ncbi:hypothetical protein BDZ89DRAFT_1043020 [Hymenopellis radicata]|nr:hypothetical protein BDZ89DRAFT_1043020 [Hymenopellis radicata]